MVGVVSILGSALRQRLQITARTLASFLLCGIAAPAAAGPPTWQIYTVPLPENDVQLSFDRINSTTDAIIHSVISITISQDDTIIYWDHWENPPTTTPSYESDISNPVETNSEVWGDLDASNGTVPGCSANGCDRISQGDIIIVEDDVLTPRDANSLYYDGGDRIGATAPVAITRAAWPIATGTLLAGAVEVFNHQKLDTSYELPIGENTGIPMFEYTGISIMAIEDGTTVSVDTNGGGTVNTSLDAGETLLVDAGTVGITAVNVGTTVTASASVQVNLVTGDIDATYEGRWYSLVPVSDWSSSYYTPVAETVTTGVTSVFLYNPGASSLTVNINHLSGFSGTCGNSTSIPAGGTIECFMPSAAAGQTSGAQFYSPGGEPFFAVSAIDTDASRASDWGFTMLPEDLLTTALQVGWGPGRDPTSTVNPSENSSPIWVIAESATTIYVDYDGDEGPNTSPCARDYDTTLSIAAFESLRIFDPDGDQTGMRVFTCDGTLIAGAWGQDPEFASGGEPALDLGTTVLPMPQPGGNKVGSQKTDTNANGVLDAGDSIEFTITVSNNGGTILSGVVIEDVEPSHTSYIANTTTVDGVPVADAGVTAFPLDEGGIVLDPINPGSESIITFETLIDDPLTANVQSIFNVANITSGGTISPASAVLPVFSPSLTIAKSSDVIANIASPGDTVTYTVTITNTGTAQQTDIVTTDAAPAGTTYVPGSTTVSGFVRTLTPTAFRDEFDDGEIYSGSDGSADWSSSPWTENGEATDPNSDLIQVVTDASWCSATGNAPSDDRCLRLGDQTNVTNPSAVYVSRVADLSTAVSATLSYSLQRDFRNGGGSVANVDCRPNPASSWTNLATYLITTDDVAHIPESFDLSLTSCISSTTEIRYWINVGDASQDYIYFDDIDISYDSAAIAAATLDNVPGGVLTDLADGATPNITTAADRFVLDAGQQMTLSYQVQVDDPLAVGNNVIVNIASATSDQQVEATSAEIRDYVPALFSYEGDNANNSSYSTLDDLYYRDPLDTGKGQSGFYVGGMGFPPDPNDDSDYSNDYQIAYYDGSGTLIFTDTSPLVDTAGNLQSRYAETEGLDISDQTFHYNQWTAVAFPAATTPPVTYDDASPPADIIVTDVFDVQSWSTIRFTDNTGTSVTTYNVNGGDDTAYVEAVDSDENVDSAAIDTITVTVSDPNTGDSIVVTLYETGVDTGVFANDAAAQRASVALADCPVTSPDPDPNTVCVDLDAQLSASHTDSSDSGDQANTLVTTPVTLSFFEARRGEHATQVHFRWSTATETQNIGFLLYAKSTAGWQRLNAHLITSLQGDSTTPLTYDFSAEDVSGDEFILVDISAKGLRTEHGPFRLQTKYGEFAPAVSTDWRSIAAEHLRKRSQRRSFRYHNVDAHGGGVAASRSTNAVLGSLSSRALSGVALLHLKVREDGVYRVTHEDLVVAGIDLDGLPLSSIAIERGGLPVPREIKGRRVAGKRQSRFGAEGHITFIGEKHPGFYSDASVYSLVVDPLKVINIDVDRRPIKAGVSRQPFYLDTVKVAPQNHYSFASPIDDPWYAERMLAYETAYEKSLTLALDHVVHNGPPALLNVEMWGGSDLPSPLDHHVQLSINTHDVADHWFDGVTHQSIESYIPTSLLNYGSNTLKVTLPADTGESFDLVNLESVAITYPRRFVARNGALTFRSAGNKFRVTSLPDRSVKIYRVRDDGQVRRMARRVRQRQDGAFNTTFAGARSVQTYHVVTSRALKTPELVLPATPVDIHDGEAHYLIVAHPDFIDAHLQRFAQMRAQDFTVKIVNVNDIYAHYSGHTIEADAIKQYIARAYQQQATRYVLLVGGDTYDYFNHLGTNAVSFVPTMYRRTDAVVSYTPTDALYADIDDDGAPDLAIGRWPVRTTAELAQIVDHTFAYRSKDYGRTAMFAADADDAATGYQFDRDSEIMMTKMPSEWHLSRAYVGDAGLSAAKNALVSNINAGVSLTSFFGHSGPSQWTFSSLLTASDVAGLTNSGRPTLVTQWGCWNTYFVSPTADSLAHAFLLNGDRGAVAVLGASTLTTSLSERNLAERLYPLMVRNRYRIGDAVLEAKRDLALTHPDRRDVLLGWALLGDPALMLDPEEMPLILD